MSPCTYPSNFFWDIRDTKLGQTQKRFDTAKNFFWCWRIANINENWKSGIMRNFNYQEQPKIETEQMRGQNAKSNTHVKIIFGSKYFLQKSHTYFCATKIFFLLEFIFCVVICVPRWLLEIVLFFSFFSDFPMFYFRLQN